MLALAVLGNCLACAPANPSADAVVGRWRVDWNCGVETLELRRDWTYSYEIDFAAGGRVIDTGKWKIVPKKERLSGAQVVLQNAVDPCSAFGERIPAPGRTDRALEAVWEWGRTVLVFNPDIQGFTRM